MFNKYMKSCDNLEIVESDAQDSEDTEVNEYVLIKYLQAMNDSLSCSEATLFSL